MSSVTRYEIVCDLSETDGVVCYDLIGRTERDVQRFAVDAGWTCKPEENYHECPRHHEATAVPEYTTSDVQATDTI